MPHERLYMPLIRPLAPSRVPLCQRHYQKLSATVRRETPRFLSKLPQQERKDITYLPRWKQRQLENELPSLRNGNGRLAQSPRPIQIPSQTRSKANVDTSPGNQSRQNVDLLRRNDSKPSSGPSSSSKTPSSPSRPVTHTTKRKAPSPQVSKSNPGEPLDISAFNLPPPKYHVGRSATGNLAVYTDYKRGGNLHQTRIRKITGDLQVLRSELCQVLKRKEKDVQINELNAHVVVKGHCQAEINTFLGSRGM